MDEILYKACGWANEYHGLINCTSVYVAISKPF